MPVTIREFQPTPNPNALKCVLDAPLGGGAGLRSYRTAPDDGAPGDALARALFAVPGVSGLLIAGDWITVSKHAEADWKSVKRGVQSALGAFEHAPAGGA